MAQTEVTLQSIKALQSSMNGKILAIMFDNDEHWYLAENEYKITNDMLVTVGDTDYIKKPSLFPSRRGGKNGGISRDDIKVWSYKPLDTIQGFLFIDDVKELEFIDKGRLYVQ